MMTLMRSRTPDADGKLIPDYISSGSAMLVGPKGELDKMTVVLSASTYNVRNATCVPICVNCNGVSAAAISPIPFGTYVYGSSQATGVITLASGTQQNVTSGGNWTTTLPSIATVNSSGLVTGQDVGTTFLSFFLNAPPGEMECYQTAASVCADQQISGDGSADVIDQTPVITGIAPSDWKPGVTNTLVSFSGQYFGTNAPTLSFSPGAGISYTLSTYNDTKISAYVSVRNGTPNEDVTVTVTNNGYGGSAFYSGSTGEPATSSPVYATVHSPMNTPEITVVAWVNGNAPDLLTLPSGANSTLMSDLADPTECAGVISAWGVLHEREDLVTANDAAYANIWLVKNSANPVPPITPTPPSVLQSTGNFRLFNDYGNGGGFYQVGSTPNPCGATAPGFILNWVGTGQSSPYMGRSGTSPSGEVYQLAEGRLGVLGQSVNQTINGMTTPWIWSVIEFDSSGNPMFTNHSIFPTFTVYKNGYFVANYPQSSVTTFNQNTDAYQLTPSQIP